MRPLGYIAVVAGCLLAASVEAGGKAADRDALRKALEDAVQHTALRSGRVSVQVVSLDDGTLVYAKNADDLLNPASNVKLVTAAAALTRLGTDFRFQTDFLTDADLKDGKAKTLFVRAKGDPTLTTERLYGIASELFHAGLREAQEIVIDESYFDGERLAPGFDQENSDRPYMAPTGAASLNSNVVAVYLRPDDHPSPKATVEVEPPSDYFVIDALVATGVRRNRRYSVLSEPMGERQKIIARGFVPAGRETWSAWRKIDNPLQYFGQSLKTVLGERGIKVKGRVRAGPVPNSARELYSAESDTLDVVLKKLNKHSSNFIAEQLLKTLGAEVAGGPGSSARGVGVVEDFLEKDVGIPRGSYAMKNGSGLNDANRFSAAQLSRLLRYMWERFPLAPEYLGSLGIAGKDGTVKYRFEGSDAVGRLRAKTGTLENVSALSGYVQSVGGEKLAFSMICNDYPGRAGPVVQGLDAMGAALAASGSTQGPDRAVAQWMTPPIVVGSLDDLKGRVKTYLAMAKPSDPRNQAFLRTAWRTERDPAVRAVVANALYVSDPQDYVAQRTLLDSFLATQDVFGRLQKVAEQLGVEVPGVASILDLAAEGNPDALARAVELSHAGKGDAVRKEIDQGLAEVARAAADELLAALRHASPSDREAALSGLARGLVVEADPDQPFWPALKKELGAPDPESAAFAKEVESTLSLKIAAEKAPKAAVAVPPPPASPPPSGASPETRPGG